MKYWLEPALKSLGRGIALTALATTLLMAQGGDVAPAPPAGASGNSAADSNANVNNEAAFRRVSNRLLCQCGCSYMVLSCNHLDCSSATFIRRTIQTSLAAGKSEDAIVAGFVEQYGPRILPEPPKKGFSLSAWIMPFVVLLLGGALVSYVLWQWKFKYQPAEAAVGETPASDSPALQEPVPALVEKYRAEIDRELEKD